MESYLLHDGINAAVHVGRSGDSRGAPLRKEEVEQRQGEAAVAHRGAI